ncbi:MAG: HU family DNA-binding protein [Blastocatellia bacterium]|nr:HU family DNA-binding protein [Blastocatellia bacterium]MCS7156658.1 HU family DNA-binding protein [Blastocatellia bacterium]MCX7751600.1 HU family DNA-binding protein [Blastocatellia bacterium]MDW8168700.1 HU family DNA-binding protein [Acidobacteriota bacterium]MDW8256966.1 HU family DNA-binding protein [Acidobacteriota bacterium]
MKRGLTKMELAEHLAQKFGLSKVTARRILEELETLAAKQVKTVGIFSLPGIGKLVLSQRKARTGRHPKTGEPIEIPARAVLKFRIARTLKTAILSAPGEARQKEQEDSAEAGEASLSA